MTEGSDFRGHDIVVPPRSPSHRSDRIGSLIKEMAAEFIERESNHTSLITVTDIVMGKGGHTVTIIVSVLPVDKAKAVQEFLHRKRSEFRELFSNRAKHLKPPTFDFVVSTTA